MTFRLVPRNADSTQAHSATLAHSAQTRPTEPIHSNGAHQEVRRQQRSTSPDPAAEVLVVAEIDSAIAELRRRAYQNAPRCAGQYTHHVQEWMTISQAADAFRISKRILSTWATQGLIASMKGQGANSHRLVHIDGILAHMQQQLHIAKEASLRVSEESDDNDTPAAEDDSNGLMQDTSPRTSSPIIVP